jgi:hypothetical protein
MRPPLQEGGFWRMIDVFSGGKRDGEPDVSEIRLAGLGRANDHWRGSRNRLKIVDLPEISGGWRLLLPVFFFQLLPEEAASLASVSRYVLFLAEISCDV